MNFNQFYFLIISFKLKENREKLLYAVRHDDMKIVKEILSRNDAAKLARAKNYYGERIVNKVSWKFISLRVEVID